MFREKVQKAKKHSYTYNSIVRFKKANEEVFRLSMSNDFHQTKQTQTMLDLQITRFNDCCDVMFVNFWVEYSDLLKHFGYDFGDRIAILSDKKLIDLIQFIELERCYGGF